MPTETMSVSSSWNPSARLPCISRNRLSLAGVKTDRDRLRCLNSIGLLPCEITRPQKDGTGSCKNPAIHQGTPISSSRHLHPAFIWKDKFTRWNKKQTGTRWNVLLIASKTTHHYKIGQYQIDEHSKIKHSQICAIHSGFRQHFVKSKGFVQFDTILPKKH